MLYMKLSIFHHELNIKVAIYYIMCMIKVFTFYNIWKQNFLEYKIYQTRDVDNVNTGSGSGGHNFVVLWASAIEVLPNNQ